MKISKEKLKQIIKEEISADEELINAIHELSRKIEDLDISVDYLAAAMTGEDTLAVGWKQSSLGRAAAPTKIITKGEG